MLTGEKLVKPHTEKHRQTGSALLCGRQVQRSIKGHQEVKRSGLLAGSWQVDPRETLRGDWSVRCCSGRDEGQGQRGVTAPWLVG